jgi:ATP-binding cassette, subfamily C (CFTR/MRP), member 1
LNKLIQDLKPTIALYAILQLILVVWWASLPKNGLRGLSIAASALSFLTSLTLCALSYVEHSKSLAPSALLNTYLVLSLIFDAVILRTQWLSPLNIAIRNIFTTSFVLKGIILVLEAKEKGQYVSNNDTIRTPEETSGLYSQGLFWWLNSIIMRGFRHILKPDGLYEVEEGMSSDGLNSRFWNTWNACEFRLNDRQ